MSVDHLSNDRIIDHLAAAADLLTSVVGGGPLDVDVPSCPGWDLRRLATHVGVVHRWATSAVITGEAPSARPLEPDAGTDMAAWLSEGADALVACLRDADPNRPTWHPFPAPQVVATWARRQAHETIVHAWDAEHARGGPTTPIDPAMASDGIDEYFSVMLPRKVTRDGASLPGYSLHVHCTDVEGEWLVAAEGVNVSIERVHAKGDAALRGPAETLLLALWGRSPDAQPDVVGDVNAARAWLAIGG